MPIRKIFRLAAAKSSVASPIFLFTTEVIFAPIEYSRAQESISRQFPDSAE